MLVPAKSELIFNFKQWARAVDGSFKQFEASWTSTQRSLRPARLPSRWTRQRLAG